MAAPKLERDLQDAMSVSEAVYLAGRVLETRLLDRQILKADRHVAQKLQLEEGSSVFYLRRLRVVTGCPHASCFRNFLCPAGFMLSFRALSRRA